MKTKSLLAALFLSLCVPSVAIAQGMPSGFTRSCEYEVDVDRWLVCARDGDGNIIGCYRTTTQTVTGLNCTTTVDPQNLLNAPGGGGGAGGGGFPDPQAALDQDADGVVDCVADLVLGTNDEVTSSIGMRNNAFHNGTDMSAGLGTGLLAGQDGTVVEVEGNWQPGGGNNGNFVRITYDDGTQGVYLHMQDVWVQPGQPVTMRQAFGSVNNTGDNSEGNHVHYSIWTTHDHTGAATDPQNFHDPEQIHGNCGS